MSLNKPLFLNWLILKPMRTFYTIALLFGSNVFMTIAWYGHLRFKEFKLLEQKGLLFFIIISWLIAFFEYCLQVPANRLGFKEHGGPFSLLELKVIQEVITLIVFVIFSLIFFKNESFKMNHLIGMVFLVLAVLLL